MSANNLSVSEASGVLFGMGLGAKGGFLYFAFLIGPFYVETDQREPRARMHQAHSQIFDLICEKGLDQYRFKNIMKYLY